MRSPFLTRTLWVLTQTNHPAPDHTQAISQLLFDKAMPAFRCGSQSPWRHHAPCLGNGISGSVGHEKPQFIPWSRLRSAAGIRGTQRRRRDLQWLASTLRARSGDPTLAFALSPFVCSADRESRPAFTIPPPGVSDKEGSDVGLRLEMNLSCQGPPYPTNEAVRRALCFRTQTARGILRAGG